MRNTGLVVVTATGQHRDAHYGPDHWLMGLSETELSRYFINDLTLGIPGVDSLDVVKDDDAMAGEGVAHRTDVKAGFVKCGINFWQISSAERRALAAAAEAFHETGASIMVHLEHGSAAHELLDLLAALDVPASAVALAHLDRNPDVTYFCELAARGAFLGCDGVARPQYWPDSTIIELIAAVSEAGFASQIMIGGDVARRSRYRAYGGLQGLDYLPLRFMPRLREALSDDDYQAITEQSVVNWLAN
jgi:phosphotriesterase-related protein